MAREPGTTLLGIGGRPGRPLPGHAGEAIAAFFPLHEAGDYEAAAAVCVEALERNPGDALALYNLACCEALLGRADDALGHLGAAIHAAPSLRETAETDTDLDSLRDDPRFATLVEGTERAPVRRRRVALETWRRSRAR